VGKYNCNRTLKIRPRSVPAIPSSMTMAVKWPLIKRFVAPTDFMIAIVYSLSRNRAYRDVWMPIPANTRVNRPIRLRKKTKLLKNV